MVHWTGEASLAVDQLLKAAERKMCEQKRAYYEQAGHDRRRRSRDE